MTFEEWYEKEYSYIYRDSSLEESFKEVALNAWLAATRNSDEFNQKLAAALESNADTILNKASKG